MEITVLILTPLPVEYNAVVAHITGQRQIIFKAEAAYELGNFVGKHHTYQVVLREPGMKNVDMALATEKAIQAFHPQIVLLVGIAGGVKDVAIGDVLIAKKVYGYESGKEDHDGFKARPAVESFSGELLARVQVHSRRQNWQDRCPDGAANAHVFIGPIAAGDKVIAGIDNPTYQRIKLHYNDTLGLEMEAIGFATALQGHRQLHGLAIRGISDLCAGKAETDQQNWQVIAAERAAAFAFELLYELDASSFVTVRHRPIEAPETKANNGQVQELIEGWQEMIARGKANEVFPKLRHYTKANSPRVYDATLHLSDRWESFERKSMMGLISNSERNVERAQITADLLNLLGKLHVD